MNTNSLSDCHHEIDILLTIYGMLQTKNNFWIRDCIDVMERQDGIW